MLTVPDGKLTRAHVAAAAAELESLWRSEGPVRLDMSEVREIDSAGIALLAGLRRRAEAEGRVLEVTGLQSEVAQALELFPYVAAPAEARRPAGWLEEIGEQGLALRDIVVEYLVLFADVAWFTVAGLVGRPRLRWQMVLVEMAAMGSRALGVVGLIAFLVGGTIALQSALQLRRFGANIFVVDLMAISLTRELGPLMAAVVVAGRSGSAVAAQLGTMVITEEVDAIRVMGLNPARYLVVPKFVAISATQPILTVWAILLGLFGGFVVAVAYLDVGPTAFVVRLQQALHMKDVITGLVKSVVFAQLIVTIGAFCGLRTRGGADAVGRSTTTSVVASIFAVIVADAAASLVFYFGG